jgi:NAD(P) transhydrogenase
MTNPTYDLIVIGSGPAGEKAAIKAAYYGYKVALVEKEEMYGGAGTNTGTIPSKTLKETALYLSGRRDKGIFGIDRQLEREVSIKDFFYRKNKVVGQQSDEVKKNLLYHNVETFRGKGRFLDPHTIEVIGSSETHHITGKYMVIATGSFPLHPAGIPFDNQRVHDSDSILNIDFIPKSIVIVGAGVIGCEYATIFANMGTEVTLINGHAEILPWLDREIAQALMDSMSKDGVKFVLENRVQNVTTPTEPDTLVRAHLATGEPIAAEVFLYAAGRAGATRDLNLEAAGLSVNDRQLISVDKTYQTQVPHIYAVGDVIGFPALASTSMDQGRVAVAHIFGLHDLEHIADDFPYGIYTIPEASAFGMTEEQAKKNNIAYYVGRAFYADMPRGRILGADRGFLKMVFEKGSDRILGVHLFGPIATELIHYGMSLVEKKQKLGDVISMIFNFPTLHELYKYAAYNALSLRGKTPSECRGGQ